VDPVIDLSPGAEHDPLARSFAEIVRANVARDWQKSEFSRLRGAAAIVADDAGTALTLRFDFGRLTIHEGLVGTPDVTKGVDGADNQRFHRMLETHKNSITIPSVAVQSGPEGSYVFTVKPDKTVAVNPVTVSFTQNNVASIASGVAEGDVVVVDGQDKLQAGSKVDPHSGGGGQNRNAESPASQAQPEASSTRGAP